MIPVSGLIALFRRMYQEHWAYEWGAAREGCVDCSGAFVWAYKQFGESIYHGSNSIARYSCGGMGKEPHPGYAAFKWRKQDTSKFPDGRGDYYHIGLVDETGEWVYEARGTKAGFTRSSVSAWHSFAPLADVEYGNPIPPSTPVDGPPFPASWEGQNVSEGGGTMEPYNAVVTTSSGSLNMRSGPGLSYPVTFKLPKGTPVTVLIEYDSGWAFVDEDGTQGYVSLKYLTRVEDAGSAQDAGQTSSVASGDTFPKGEGLDGTAVKWGVFAPCDSREEAEALQKAHKGAILTCYNPASYKPPDEGGD